MSLVIGYHCASVQLANYYLVVYSEGLPGSFLVPTVDGTDCEGVVCPQDQSRTGVVLTGTILLARTGGGVRGD